MAYNDWVDWRLANGSECAICPLNGQRKVGCIGDPDAGPILILEAPGAEEESYNKDHQKYGVPIVGRSGWALKFKLLAPAGLVEIEEKENGWPKVTKWNTFVMNRIMCRPPDSKRGGGYGKIGKKAAACCSNSAKALLKLLIAQNPDRTLIPSGGEALDLTTAQATIGPYRGRVLSLNDSYLSPMPQDDIMKKVFKGMKPPLEAETYLKIIKVIVSKSQSSLKSAPLKAAKAAQKAHEMEMKSLLKPHLTLLNVVLTKQRKSLSLGKSVSSSKVSQPVVSPPGPVPLS
jgi:uracil-DNA glycosylase